MNCKKCGDNFATRVVINDKVRNLQNRKYCLKCSPFGYHNVKKLETSRSCSVCGKESFRNNNRRRKCWSCANKISREYKIKRIKEHTGDSCWFCGYNNCWQAMDFHHVNPKDKLFGLSTREMQFSWVKIFDEIKKCVLTCCRCHREIHSGLILQTKVIEVWKQKWAVS